MPAKNEPRNFTTEAGRQRAKDAKTEKSAHTPGLFQIRHESGCRGICKAEEYGVLVAQSAQSGDRHYPTGPWIAYYAHDTQDGDGNAGLSFQVLVSGLTEELVRAAIAKAEGK